MNEFDESGPGQFPGRDPAWGRRAEDRITLRSYVELLVAEVNRRLGGVERSTERIAEAQEKLLTKEWYETHHEPLDERLREVELWKSNVMGRALALALVWTVLVAAITAALVHAFAG